MPIVSSIFLVLAMVLAVAIGPQMRPWTWGPALLALAMAIGVGLPAIWRKQRTGDFGVIIAGILTAGWFAWRAWISPVRELGDADLLLLAATVGVFIAVRCIEDNRRAERTFIWGLALLLLASIVVCGMQLADPSFTPVFYSRITESVSGFFAHYIDAANYLVVSSVLVGSSAVFGNHRRGARWVLGLVAAAGMGCVYFTHSRGGILAAGAAMAVFCAGLLIRLKHRKPRWFAPAMIGLPVAAVLIAGAVYFALAKSQAMRSTTAGIPNIFDNNARLYFLGVALSCVSRHPLVGGGSRSFSWECFRFMEGKLQGDILTNLPEQVHNEPMQAACDYGLIGAGLLMAVLGTLALVAVVRIVFPSKEEDDSFRQAWLIGGLAALAGMFVQSCFSFVYHLLPGAMLLGIALAQLSRSSNTLPRKVYQWGGKILLTAAALATLAICLAFGPKGVRVTRELWATHYGKHPTVGNDAKIAALTAAIPIWPQAMLYKDRANLLLESAAKNDGKMSQRDAEAAVSDYAMAQKLHPYDPQPVINRANVLSYLGRDDEAETAYAVAVELQRGMEPAFHARFRLAVHLLRKGIRQFSVEYPEDARKTLESAAEQMEEASRAMHWLTPEMVHERVTIHESLGSAREAEGDYNGAMEAYNFASTLAYGSRGHYRAGTLHGKIAAAAWSSRKPGEALAHFQAAKDRIFKADELPAGITPEQKASYLAYLNESITYLEGAKIEPVKSPPW